MANNELIADFQRMRQEVVQQRGACLERIDKARGIDAANDVLRVARDHEQKAVYSDEEKQAEIKRLIEHVNGLPNKPRVFLERISKLESELPQTSALRKQASEIARLRQKQVQDATTLVELAEIDLKAIEKNLADVDEQLRQNRGY